jgi:hypothetical protein
MKSNSLWQSNDPRYTFGFRLRDTATTPAANDTAEPEPSPDAEAASTVVADDLDRRIARLDFNAA